MNVKACVDGCLPNIFIIIFVFDFHPPQKGLCLFVSAAAQNAVDSILRQWTLRRPVRTANDLACPF